MKKIISKRNLIRPFILLGVLGGISLFSSQIFSMEEAAVDVDSIDGGRSTSPVLSSLHKNINTKLNEDLKNALKALPQDVKDLIISKENGRLFWKVADQYSSVSTKAWLDAMGILACKGNRKQKEHATRALVKILEEEQHPDFPKLEITTFLLEKMGESLPQYRQSLERTIQQGMRNSTYPLKKRSEFAEFLFLEGSQEASSEAETFLGEYLTYPDDSFSFEERVSVLRTIMDKGRVEFGKVKLKQVIRNALLAGKSFQDCRASLWGFRLKKAKTALSDIYLEIAQEEGPSFSSQMRFSFAADVLEVQNPYSWMYRRHEGSEEFSIEERTSYSEKVFAILFPFFSDESIPLKDRLHIADKMLYQEGLIKERGYDFLFSQAKNESLPPLERLETARKLLSLCKADKEEREYLFDLLESLVQSVEPLQSLKEFTETINGLSFQMESLDQTERDLKRDRLYALLSSKAQGLEATQDVINAHISIARNGPPSQKEKACDRLLSFFQQSTLSSENRYYLLKCIVENGTEDQRKVAYPYLLNDVNSLPLEKQIDLLKMVAGANQGEQKEDALRRLFIIAQDPALSLDMYFGIIRFFVWKGSQDQTKTAFTLFEKRLEGLKEASQLKAWLFEFDNYLSNKKYSRERASTLVLSFLNSLGDEARKTLSFETLQRAIGLMESSKVQEDINQGHAFMLSFMEADNTLKMVESLSDEYKRFLSNVLEGKHAENKERAFNIISSFLENRVANSKFPNEIHRFFGWGSSSEHRQRAERIIFPLLQNSQNLSPDDLIDAARFIFYGNEPARREIAKNALIGLARKVKSSPCEYWRIAEIFGNFGRGDEEEVYPNEKEEICTGLMSFLGGEEDSRIYTYVARHGSKSQKHEVCERILLRMTSSQSVKDLKEDAYTIVYHGSLAQQVNMLSLLLKHPEFSYNEWGSFFYSSYEYSWGYDNQDAARKSAHQKRLKTITEGLIDVLENSEDEISLEKRVKCISRFAWRDDFNNRVQGFLAATLEKPGQLPCEILKEAAHLIIRDQSAEKDHCDIASNYLLSLMNKATFSLEERLETARGLMKRDFCYPSEQARKEAKAFLVLALVNDAISLEERKEIALSLLERENGRTPEEQICVFLLSFLAHSESTLSKEAQEARIRIARTVIKFGTEEQSKQASQILFRENMGYLEGRSPYDYINMLREVFHKVTSEEEKAKAGEAVFSFVQDPEIKNDGWYKNNAIELIFKYGVPRHKEQMCALLWHFFETKNKVLYDEITPLHLLARLAQDPSLTHHREKAFSVLFDFSKEKQNSFNARLSALQTLIDNGDKEHKKNAVDLLFSLVTEETHWASLKNRLEHLRRLIGTDVKNEALTLLLKLLETSPDYPLKDRLESLSYVFHNGTSAQIEEVCSRILLFVRSEDITLTSKEFGWVLQRGNAAQLEEACSLVLSSVQKEESSLSLNEKIELVSKIFNRETGDHQAAAYTFLRSLERQGELSEGQCIQVARILIGADHYSYDSPKRAPEHVEGGCEMLLRLLKSATLSLSPNARLNVASTISKYGTSSQKDQACTFGISLIKQYAGTIHPQEQTEFLIGAVKQAGDEISQDAEKMLFSLFESPETDAYICKSIVRSLCWLQREAESNWQDTDELRNLRVKYRSLWNKIHARLIDSLLNFENGLSLEKRFDAVNQMTENFSNSSNASTTPYHTKAFDALLTLMEHPDTSPEMRLRTSKNMLSYRHGINVEEENQKERARVLLWSVLVDPRTDVNERREAGLFLVKYGYRTIAPAGAGSILMSLMKDPYLLEGDNNYWPGNDRRPQEEIQRERLLLAQKEISVYLAKFGQTEAEKEEGRKFTLTLLESRDQALSLKKLMEIGKEFIDLDIPEIQKKRGAVVLLSLIQPTNTLLSPKIYMNIAIKLINTGIVELREEIKRVLVHFLNENEQFSYLDEYLRDRHRYYYDPATGKTYNGCWHPQLPQSAQERGVLSSDGKEFMRSVFLSYARENRARLSAEQKRILNDMIPAFTNMRQRLELLTFLSEAPIPDDRLQVFLNVLEISGAELFQLVPPQRLNEMITGIAREQNLHRWGEIIEETLIRFRPQPLARRMAGAAAAQRQPTVAEEIRRQGIIAREIHNFMHEATDEGGRIEDGVIHIINRKLSSIAQGAEIVIKTYGETFAFIKAWVKENVSSERYPNAIAQLQTGIEISLVQNSLQKIHTFLERFYPDKIDMWMRGFIMDSLNAYADHTSCSEGVAERPFTALGGIDPEIDAVLRRPFAIQSAKFFIAQCNFRETNERGEEENKQWVIRNLRNAGITKESTSIEAALAFRQFGTSQIQSLNLGAQKQRWFLEQIELFSDLLESSFEDEFKPHMRSALRDQIEQAIAAASAPVAGSKEKGLAASLD
ncbi:MAG: hypothetical protein JSS34_01430 [Proteobacteria bacterium]|nr:hypothetical protein [Pseudomonadota bacterium]